MLQSKILKKLKDYYINNLNRKIIEINSNDGRLINSRKINFSSNDYLGLSKNILVKKAFIEGSEIYGFGSGSSALISGYYSPVRQLEEEFAKILKAKKAMFFNSGYHANLGVIQALDMPLVIDKLSHASIIDGAKLSSNKFYRYRHNDLNHAEELLKKYPSSLLISERVFSMEGCITNIKKLQLLSKKYKSHVIIDDAHGFGVLDNDIELDDHTTVIVPLGKALGGIGAIVAGSEFMIDYLRQFSRSYIYSTALPPAVACANLKALNIMQEEKELQQKLIELIIFFNIEAKNAQLNLVSDHITPIRSILIDGNENAKRVEKELQKEGFFVKAILRPTVPSSRLRISISAFHQKKDIVNLIRVLNDCKKLLQ